MLVGLGRRVVVEREWQLGDFVLDRLMPQGRSAQNESEVDGAQNLFDLTVEFQGYLQREEGVPLSKIRELNDAARKIGQDVVVLNADAEREFEPAFDSLTAKRASALVVADDALFAGRRARLIELAARHAVPAIYGRREYPDAGGLISYGASTVDQYYQCGVYVGRILKGARPGDLPFLQPTKFELVLNLKTAKAMGLSVPPALIARADEVIE